MLRNITQNGFIAGGYPRDVVLGGQPKDIDIFLNGSQHPAGPNREDLVDRLFAAFGQTWTKDRPAAAVAEGNPVYNAPAINVDNAFEVYYMATTDRTWEPLNVIFSRNNERGARFDWSICCAFVDFEGNDNFNLYFTEKDQDLANVTLFDTTYMDQAIAHALRLREKYPQMQFKVPHRYLRQQPGCYEALIRGGVIDVPREILPPEAEAPAGNPVGLNAGVRPAQRTNRFITAAEMQQQFMADMQLQAFMQQQAQRVQPVPAWQPAQPAIQILDDIQAWRADNPF